MNVTKSQATLNIWIGAAGDPITCNVQSIDVKHDDQGDRDECPKPGKLIRYKIRTGNASQEAAADLTAQVAQKFERADWTGLYALMAPSVTTSVTQSDFIAMMHNQGLGPIQSAKIVSPGKTATAKGETYFNQDLSLTITKPTGPPATYTTTLFSVFQKGRWWVLSTSTPVPSP